MKKLVIGTRGSKLALWQAHTAKEMLSQVTDRAIEIKVISTRGDERLEIALHDHKLTKGLFTEELERELLSGEIDFAVHSLKDLPVELPEGLELSAVLTRADARDVIISNHKVSSLSDLAGHKIGTSSPRRVAQLTQAIGRDKATYEPIRGNVQTRIQKLRSGEYDSIVMAAAGIERLGLTDEIAFYIPLDEVLPAPGQACVAIQSAINNQTAYDLARKINDPIAELETYSERRLLQLLGGGCALPLGALGKQINSNEISLIATYANNDFSLINRYESKVEIAHLESGLATFTEQLRLGI